MIIIKFVTYLVYPNDVSKFVALLMITVGLWLSFWLPQNCEMKREAWI
jgi:hypothetical protein